MYQEKTSPLEVNYQFPHMDIEDWDSYICKEYKYYCRHHGEKMTQRNFRIFLLGEDREFHNEEATPQWYNYLPR